MHWLAMFVSETEPANVCQNQTQTNQTVFVAHKKNEMCPLQKGSDTLIVRVVGSLRLDDMVGEHQKRTNPKSQFVPR